MGKNVALFETSAIMTITMADGTTKQIVSTGRGGTPKEARDNAESMLAYNMANGEWGGSGP